MAGGRPTKLTPQVQARIVSAIRGGNYRQVAAEWAGVHRVQLARWMKRGLREAGIYREFRNAVLEAEREAEVTSVARVMKAAEEDPKHAQWWLARKFPKRWARKDKHEVTGKGGGPVRITQVEVVRPDGGAGGSHNGRHPPAQLPPGPAPRVGQ